METFGEQLKQYRTAAGLTQAQFAERLDVHLQTVSKWERNLSQPDMVFLGEIAHIFQISLEKLLLGADEGEIPNDTFSAQQFGKALSEVRKRSGKRQEGLASELFVSADTISRWERGVSCPSIDELIDLARILQLPLSALYFGALPLPATHSQPKKNTFKRTHLLRIFIPLLSLALCGVLLACALLIPSWKSFLFPDQSVGEGLGGETNGDETNGGESEEEGGSETPENPTPPNDTKEDSYENYAWRTTTGGVEIYDYLGTFGREVELVLPSEIDGQPVVKVSQWENALTNTPESSDWVFKSLTLPQTLKEINRLFLFNQTILSDLIIPASVETLGEACFGSLTVPKIQFQSGSKIKAIPDTAFSGITTQSEIVIPSSVQTIGDYSFSSLQNVSILFEENSQLTAIGRYAFYNSTLSQPLAIPKSVQTLGDSCFYKITVDEVSFEQDGLLQVIPTEAFAFSEINKSVILPNGVEKIRKEAFYNAEINGIYLPDGLTLIEESALGIYQNTKAPDFTLFIPSSVVTLHAKFLRTSSYMDRTLRCQIYTSLSEQQATETWGADVLTGKNFHFEVSSVTLTLNDNGVQTVQSGNQFILPILKKEGFEFLGWFDAEDKKVSSVFSAEEDCTLTAKYQAI